MKDESDGTAALRATPRRAWFHDGVEHPRLLLVPQVCALDWQIASQLSEWAEVATYDAPGVGDEPLAGEIDRQAIARRGLDELDRLGWERCVLVADEFGVPTALLLARMRPEAVAGLALGHACLSHDVGGDRPPVSEGVLALLVQVAHNDHRTWARHLTQVTQGAYDDDLVERYLERVPPKIAAQFGRVMQDSDPSMRETLEQFAARGVPMLFARHDGCLMFTPEGYADATAAFPAAVTVSTSEKPSASPAFAEALHSFCLALAPSERRRQR
jgi:pimeloyl-ACP methyl ester carboxylesterase